MQGSDGNFYGTTASGGAFTDQNGEGFGTVFRMTLDGTITTLYSFTFSGPDGKYRQGPGLAQDSDGNFYGAAYPGGPDSFGTIFKITPDGGLTTVYWFSGSDGSFPNCPVVGADRNLYGMASAGGISFNGANSSGYGLYSE